jgi:hypothetical protein
MKRPLFLLLLCLSARITWSQGELPVDMYTGQPDIQVPITAIAANEVSDIVSLRYDASGVKATAVSGLYGINWNLSAGGSIRREVRGLPDDFLETGQTITRTGWLYSGANQTPTTFLNSSDNNAATCTDEVSDYQSLLMIGNYRDTEPDVFSYNLPGYAGKFVFDNGVTPQIRMIPYQDLVIQPIFVSPTDKKLLGFTITTNSGDVYTFQTAQYESRVSYYNTPVELFRRDFEFYASYYAPIQYNSAWHLSNVKASSGAKLEYTYVADTLAVINRWDVAVREYDKTTYAKKLAYATTYFGNTRRLTQIRSSTGAVVKIIKTSDRITAIELWDSRNGDNSQSTTKFIKKFTLSYLGGYLNAVQEISGTEQMPPYRFEYNGYYSPQPDTKSQDFWGYYNGKANETLFPEMHIYPALPAEERYRLFEIPGYVGEHYVMAGADRKVNTQAITMGALNALRYPWGGTIFMEYESNVYYDSIADMPQYGGGIRLKSTRYADGTNPAAEVIKQYQYTDALGKTSGRIIAPPTFAIGVYEYRNPTAGATVTTIPYELMLEQPAERYWTYLTVRTERDISRDALTKGSAVGYKEVKVSRPGAGYVIYEFSTSGHWRFPTLGLWTPAVNKYARYTSCPSPGIAERLGGWMYPYAPNPDLDMARGLVRRERQYDETGVLVKQISTGYTLVYKDAAATQPFTVSGLVWDMYPNDPDRAIRLFAKYHLLTDFSFAEKKVTTTQYDAVNAARNVETSTEFFRASTAHRLLTSIVNTGADGAKYTTYTRYPQDYGTIPSGADKAAQMIGVLQSTNRTGVAVEQYSTRQKPGGTENVVGASIVKYDDFGVAGKALPKQPWAWRTATTVALASFVPSYINATTKALTLDTRYEAAGQYIAYDTLDQPSYVIGENKVPATTIWSSVLSAPVVNAVHTAPGEFAFSDFEAGTEASFSLTSTATDQTPVTRVIPGHTGQYGVYPEVSMSKLITKGAATYYTLSGWWNKFATSFSVTVTIKNGATTVSTNTFTVTPSAGTAAYDYFEFRVPVSSAPATFTATVTYTSSGSTGQPGLPAIDDIAFYPEHARLVTYTYQAPFGVSSVTSGDNTSYTVYDALGREKYHLDRDKNIIQKKSYQFTN